MDKILKYSRTIIFTAITTLPALVGAAPLSPAPSSVNGLLPTSICSLFDTVVGILDYLFYALILLTIFFVIMAAFKYLTSAGDPEKVKESNKHLLYAAAAIVVGILSYGIPRIAASIIGITLNPTCA